MLILTVPLCPTKLGQQQKDYLQPVEILLKLFYFVPNLLQLRLSMGEHIFQFLEREDVPYDNNASERSIRPLKVKQKVSGMFKNDDNADAFSQLQTIADTARKNNQDPFLALVAVAENVCNEK